ncbi:MAG: efflux RND transporter periplasmic adaptor subunit [Balneolaceae bacterium]|nr:efflux RND transporter periplasmic adaptor subunit [Balneolaceae bacterium]
MAKEKKNPTKKLLIFAGIFIAVFGIGAVIANSMGWIGGGDEGKTVETAEAKYKTITQVVSASGKIQPEVEIIIRPDVSGEIIQLNVREGDYVQKGDLLLRIRPEIYQARIDEINASLLTQKAREQQAKAGLIEAESAFKRQEKLYNRDLISESAYIQAKTEYESQQANYEATKYQVQSVEAQLQQAREELQKTIVRAPKDGTVSKLAVEQGERVLGSQQVAGTEMMRIADMNQMEVMVEVNENDIVNVSMGDTANIQVDAYPERTFKGVVTEIANSAMIGGEGTSEQVTNYEVKIRVTTPHNLDMAAAELRKEPGREMSGDPFSPNFKPGMSGTVDIQSETVEQVVAIPIQAVTVRDFSESQQRGSSVKKDSATSDTLQADEQSIIPKEDLRKVVFVVKDGKAIRHEVKTGISDNTHIQILSGVENGDEIVIGSYRVLSKELTDGDPVRVNNNAFGGFASNN